MAKMNGCNDSMAKPSGDRSTRVNPATLGRANMAKGGVNQDMTKGKMSRPPMAKGSKK
jgi:hypothetical protein